MRFRVGLIAILTCLVCCNLAHAEIPKNVILLIGDGMGSEHVKAGAWKNGGPLSFESFAYKGELTTHTANSGTVGYPDSAGTATAMATGHKVNNGVISVDGDGKPLTTMLEVFQSRGKATGLVTNVPMTHATPAAFAAHQAKRESYGAIATDMLATKPNVLLGSVKEAGGGITAGNAGTAGYSIATTHSQLKTLVSAKAEFVSGQFGDGRMPYEGANFGDLPHLSDMTEAALGLLQHDDDGFFLMVEGGLIDWAAHDNDLAATKAEVVEFSNSVQAVLDWAGSRDDTLVLVTADHETGGLTFNPDGSHSWLHTGHTDANVPIYAWGANAHLVGGVMDNTDIFGIATVPEPSSWVLVVMAIGVGAMVRRWRR